MARSCSICIRDDAGTINGLLLGGRSARSVAAEFGLSHRALLRHNQNHASRPGAAQLPAVQPVGDLDPLDELVVALRLRALAGNPADTREYRLALAAQQTARHAAASARALADEPEWIALRTRLLALLEPFPEARLALADGLEVA
jgi:hypothetical protein